MAEQPETPKILEEISKNTKSGSASRKQQTARRRVLFILIMLFPIIACVLYLGYSQFAMQQELAALRSENAELTSALSSQNSQINTQMNTLQEQLAAVPQAVAVDDSATRELQAQLEQEVARLTSQLSRLTVQQNSLASQQADSTGNEQLWKLLEAENLLAIANRKIQLESDPASAATLMQQADQALLESGSPNVIAAREAIAADLSALQAVEMLDREGVYLRLQNLANQIDQVDMVGSMRENFEAQRNRSSVAVQSGTETTGLLDSSLQFLGSIFVWRRWDEAPEAMLAPGNEAAIMQRLQLSIEQAKLAVLTANNELYQINLADCVKWLEQYAVVESELGATVLAEVAALRLIDVDPALPAPANSINQLRQLTAALR